MLVSPSSYTFQRRRRSANPLLKLLLFIMIFGFITYLTLTNINRTTRGEVQPTPFPTLFLSPTLTPIPPQGLKDSIESALTGTQGTYGIVVRNFETGESYYSQERRVFQPASVYKLWVMAVVYDQIKQGLIKEDDILTDDVAKLNAKFKISTEAAELTEGTMKFTVSEALQQMIAISHNYAALLLTDKVKVSNLQKFLDKNNFNDSKVGNPPRTTPYDVALFFEKLYKGELADAEYTQKMIDLLKQQKLNYAIPKYLPESIEVAHKTGELDTFAHDAGIVYSPKGDYIIVLFSESNNTDAAEERIANISAEVFNYFNNKTTQ